MTVRRQTDFAYFTTVNPVWDEIKPSCSPSHSPTPFPSSYSSSWGVATSFYSPPKPRFVVVEHTYHDDDDRFAIITLWFGKIVEVAYAPTEKEAELLCEHYESTPQIQIVEGVDISRPPDLPESRSITCPWCQEPITDAKQICQLCGDHYHKHCGITTLYTQLCNACRYGEALVQV